MLTFAANGELLKYINRSRMSLECAKFYSGNDDDTINDFSEMTKFVCFRFIAELLLAIEEMHKKNIIHR